MAVTAITTPTSARKTTVKDLEELMNQNMAAMNDKLNDAIAAMKQMIVDAVSKPGRAETLSGVATEQSSGSQQGSPPSLPPVVITDNEVCVQRSCNLISWRYSPTHVQKKAWKVSCSQVEVKDDLNEEACELVSGEELILGDDDDNFHAYLFKAVKNNNGTGILLLSDIFGFADSFTRDFSYRVACNGYNVLVPDLFRGDPWARDRPKTSFEQWLAGQDRQRVAKYIDTSTKWMLEEFLVAGFSKRLGLIGFCFGGGRVVDVLAGDENSSFSTGVSFYGTRMDASAAAKVKVPVLFISGDKDPLCPVNVLTDFERIIGKGSRAVIFKGRGHGFAHRPDSAEEDADADQAFMIMRNWLHDRMLVSD